MVNKVASNFQVDLRLQCMLNCTFSPVCDSYNYRSSDKTQHKTHMIWVIVLLVGLL